jgi:transposase InsO family protein
VCELSYQYSRYGYRKIHPLMIRAGWQIGREAVRLIRRRERLQVRRKQSRRRLLGCSTQNLLKAEYPNHVWSYDFVHDRTTDARALKYLTVVDEFTHEGLMIHVNRSITSATVIDCLGWLFELYGKPECIKSDNGPEFVANRVQAWLKERHVMVHYIEPGSPWQNGHNESFNGVFRDGCLNRWWFENIQEARLITEQWLKEYNEIRPHGSIGQMTPFEYACIHRKQLKKVA